MLCFFLGIFAILKKYARGLRLHYYVLWTMKKKPKESIFINFSVANVRYFFLFSVDSRKLIIKKFEDHNRFTGTENDTHTQELNIIDLQAENVSAST